MFTIDYVYGSRQVFDTLEAAEQEVTRSSQYESYTAVIIAEIQKVVRPKRPLVDLEEISVDSIKRKEEDNYPSVEAHI